MKSFIIFISVLLIFNSVYADEIDSLKQELKNNPDNCEIINSLSSKYISVSKDSSLKYCKFALKIAQKENNYKQIALSYKTLGTLSFYKSDIDKALTYYANAYDNYDKAKDIDGLAAILHNIGTMYNFKGENEKAIKYYDKSIEYEIKLGNYAGCAKTYNNIGVLYQQISKYDLAKKYYLKAYKIHKREKDLLGIAKVSNNLGNIFLYQSKYNEATKYYKKALDTKIKLDDKNGIAVTYSNLGMVHSSMGEYNKAIEYYKKALNIYDKTGNLIGKAQTINKIGNIFLSLNNIKQARKNFFEAIKIFTKNDNKKGLATCYNNLGVSYSMQNNTEFALQYYLKAMQLLRIINSENDLAKIYLNIGDVYFLENKFDDALYYTNKAYDISVNNNFTLEKGKSLNALSKIYYQKKQYDKAFNLLQKSIKINKQIKNSELLINNYETLRDIYLIKKDFKNAYFSYKNYITLRDSSLNAKTKKQINELQSKYDIEKKQKTIQLLKTREKAKNIIIKKNNETIKYQRNFIYLIILIIIIVLFFSIALYKQVKQKQKANKKLKEKQNQIIEKNEELNQQNAEIMAQRDEITNQRDLLQEQKQEITDSINYAKIIQNAILMSDAEIKNIFNNYFVLYKPKDIVSGDFYWFAQKGDYRYFAAVDCTGHGVPGAFLSIIGKKSLDKAINEYNITEPADILNTLNTEIFNTFHKKNLNEDDIKDGMDMALCRVDIKNKKLVFAGANNPLYLIKNEKLKITDENKFIKEFILNEDKLSEESQQTSSKLKRFYEIKPDKQAIGINIYNSRKLKFTQKEISIEKGDVAYVFSDGYADQFGGEKGKKFKYKNFRKLLIQHTDDLQKQKQFLEKSLAEWQNGYRQIDDILVIGIKF